LSFQRRNSDMFTTVDRVLEEIKAYNWNVECLAWYPVLYEEEEEEASASTSGLGDSHPNGSNDQDQSKKTEKEVFLFEISPVITKAVGE